MTNAQVNRCLERSGFLFAHRCEEAVQFQCRVCNKYLCNRHCYRDERGEVCLSCHKKRPDTERQPAAQRAGRNVDDDPYYYGYHYYPDYDYYDSRDYRAFDSRAQGAAAGQPGAAPGFEGDFEGS